MKVIMHYPETEEDIAVLRQKISKVHAQAVASYLQNLNCPKEQKIKALNHIKDSIQE